MPTDRSLESPLIPATPSIGARPLRLFIGGVAAVCVLVAALVGLSLAVLYSNGENISPVEAARLQVQSGGLYGSALVYRPYPYKLELYRLEQPDVAVVGSSRAMAFVSQAFSAPMTNLGGAVNEIVEAKDLVPEMLAAHRPKLMLITLDFWWFNARRYDEDGPINRSPDITFSLDDVLKPFEWLAQGDLHAAGVLRTMFEGTTSEPLIGTWANQNHSGFDRYGTRFYGAQLTGEAKADDPRFKSTLKRLRGAHSPKSAGKLNVTAPFSEAGWQELMATAAAARQAGVEVRFIVPPVAPPVLDAIRQTAPHTLIDDLHEHLASSGYPYYDFSDPATLGAGSCEFVDGFHGGFVVYLRILRKVAADLEARPALRALIQPDAVLTGLINGNVGRATLRGQEWAGKENDFLKLGCDKS